MTHIVTRCEVSDSAQLEGASGQAWLQEFIDSAVSPALALANIEYLEGPVALEAFLSDTLAQRQKVKSYVTTGNARLLGKYRFIEDGAWFARSAFPTAPYCKPRNPRPNPDKIGKPIKYETPEGGEGGPIFPPELGPVGMTWPEIFDSPSVSIAITEGAKKALALISQGVPAVALRGVYSWREGKGRKALHPLLAKLAAGGRKVYIAYDQDTKAKTVADVHTQAERLGAAIEKAGGQAYFPRWDASQGKGIDDALAALPLAQRAEWLAKVMQRSERLKGWRRRATKARARAILAQRPPVAHRETSGGYLPELPPLIPGAVHWLDANMGSGKTYRIGRDWVKPWPGITVVLSPLNSLGQQTAKDWGLPHIHDYGLKVIDQVALEADISVSGGLVACLNSAHRILELIPQNAPLLLVIDEAAQTLTDAAQGGTLKGEWAARWEDFITLAERAANSGAIVLAEAGLGQDTIDLVKALAPVSSVLGIRHRREADTWPVRLHHATPVSEYRGNLLERLKAGDRVFYVTTSKAEGRRLERAALAAGVTAIHRIDSETNEGGVYRQFFETPEAWLYAQLPQLVILTPSGKTGLSIEGGISAAGAYFDSVWGYFPSLDSDTAMQLLGRYRPPVPRVIWAPAYIKPEANERPSPLAITHDLETEAARYSTYGGFGQANPDPLDSALKRYLAQRGQRRWAQKIQAGEALTARLEAAGHDVTVLTEGTPNKAVKAQWDDIKEALAREDSERMAGLELDPEVHTLNWAFEISRKTDSTQAQRLKAAKVRMQARFPGLDWNCAELWYQAEYSPSLALAPGAALWAEAGYYQALWERDAREAQGILSQRLRAAHLLPQSGPRAMLAAAFRPLLEALEAAGEVSPMGATEERVKALALTLAGEIRRYWRLTITESQSAVEIVNKIAAKLGFDAGGVANRLRKVSTPTGRQWVYRLGASDTWRALVKAREWALAQWDRSVNESPIANNRSVPSPPPPGEGEAPQRPPSPPDSPPPGRAAA